MFYRPQFAATVDAEGVSIVKLFSTFWTKHTPSERGPVQKAVFIVVPLILLLIGTLAGISMYASPAAQMNRAIRAVGIELAYDIFDENFLPEELSDKSVELLKKL